MEDDHKFWHEGQALLSEKAVSRRVFRSLVFHFLYALDAYEYQTPLSLIISNFNEGYDLDITLDGDIAIMVQSVADQREELDSMIIPVLSNWRIDRLGCVTLLILRMGLWELRYTKTPVNIVINEAVELAKCFAEKDSYRFVNGILDQLAGKLHLSDGVRKEE
jgi:N utilization substance protein B